jgi:hypothetical protein
MAEQEVRTATVEEIFADAETPQMGKLLTDIFADIHPRLGDKQANLSEIFTPESAGEFLARLTDFESLLSAEDDYEQTLDKFQSQIDAAEKVRDEVLAKLYEVLRPLEASYRQIWLFYENTVVPDGKQRKAVEFYIYNGDAAAMKNRESITLEAIRRFVASRNDNFNFRDDICNLIVPGAIPMEIREALEEETWKWGMLLITDLADEKSFREVERQFRPGGRYEFLKRPDNKAASDVVMVGTLKLRDSYWFEKNGGEEDDLYVPASMIFAGALARTDRMRNNVAQGAIGSKFGQIKGVEKARIECQISQMELLSQEMQVIPIIRDADNHLCFYGCRSLADDKYGVYKFFSAYRILSYLERVTAARLRELAGARLTRDFIDAEVEAPLRRLLEEQVAQGAIYPEYDISIDRTSNKLMQGICDIYMMVMPVGPAEVFRVKIDTPEFEAYDDGPQASAGG